MMVESNYYGHLYAVIFLHFAEAVITTAPCMAIRTLHIDNTRYCEKTVNGQMRNKQGHM